MVQFNYLTSPSHLDMSIKKYSKGSFFYGRRDGGADRIFCLRIEKYGQRKLTFESEYDSYI